MSLVTLLGALCLVVVSSSIAAATDLAIDGSRFTIDGRPTFLLGCSYYGAMGGPAEFVRQDLDELQRLGFNWIRVWATWSAFDHDISIVDDENRLRPAMLERLERLVRDCDRRGLIVDVTVTRGGRVSGPPRLQKLADHRRAVEAIVERLKPYRNWYLDLGNERNIRDARFVSFEDLTALAEAVRRIDPKRLVTASHAGDVSGDDLKRYVDEVRLDFLAPHRPRGEASPSQTEEMTRKYLASVEKLGRVIPVHYQEPLRRGFGRYDPPAEAFVEDCRGAIRGGAAGWCFHNGDQRNADDGRPRRSFDLREQRMFDQLDAEEQAAVEQLGELIVAESESASR